MKIQTEAVIIGGGATGVGILRDLSLRGIPSLLLEKGTSSRRLRTKPRVCFTVAGDTPFPTLRQPGSALPRTGSSEGLLPTASRPRTVSSSPFPRMASNSGIVSSRPVKRRYPDRPSVPGRSPCTGARTSSGNPGRRQSPGRGRRSLYTRPRKCQGCRGAWGKISPSHGNRLPPFGTRTDQRS